MQTEIIHGQAQCIRHRCQSALDIFGHDVNLDDLFFVVHFERLEIRLAKSFFPVLIQSYRHRGTEHRQPFIQANDFLLVQPQQGVIHAFLRIFDLVLEQHIGIHRRQ